MLRRRVLANMRLALGDDVPAEAARRYFRHAGWFYSSALITFHHGFAATPIQQEIKFDDTIRVLDEAAAEGRGVVLAVPHWSGHELAAAALNLSHPMVMLVRQAATSEREVRKLEWYRALGAKIVQRPAGSSTIRDAAAYLRVLKSGRLLAITPDLLAGPQEGIEVSLFGRRARLHAGAFTLAIAAKAPMIRVSGRWQDDQTALLTFERAPAPVSRDRDTAVRAAVQDWCVWFEQRLREHPENWLFWLDKRWSHFLRSTPRISGAA
jgi:KDO2-lipid IV(A) lauroyltransferase